MIAYIDASVALRVVLDHPGKLNEWQTIETGVANALVEVECLRTLDRLRLHATISGEEFAARCEAVYRLTGGLKLVAPDMPILRRAAQPLPTALGTLDAIHLATAATLRETLHPELVMATHDHALGRAARATGFPVIGL